MPATTSNGFISQRRWRMPHAAGLYRWMGFLASASGVLILFVATNVDLEEDEASAAAPGAQIFSCE